MVIDFSDRLRELRLEKGYSQATLSQKITNLGQPLSEAALAKYESGRTIPNLQVAAYLADYFGVSIDYLACGEKASVLSTEGLKEEQIRLIMEIIGALQKQNQTRYTATKTQPTQELLKKRRIINAAAGREPSDLVLKNATYVNVFSNAKIIRDNTDKGF